MPSGRRVRPAFRSAPGTVTDSLLSERKTSSISRGLSDQSRVWPVSRVMRDSFETKSAANWPRISTNRPR